MKHLWNAILCAVISFLIVFGPVAAAQNDGASSIQTGFAIVTPLENTAQALSVSEIFSQQVGDSVFRSSVLPSPLVTLTSVLIRSDPNIAVNTGIAIVNPNAGVAAVTLTLNNNQGAVVAVRVFVIQRTQQISRFITELFPDAFALTGPFEGLLFINSDIPVGVMGLTFQGPAFTALPVASQLISTDVAVNPGNAGNGTITAPPQNSVNAVPTSSIGQPSTAFIFATPTSPVAPLTPPPFFMPNPIPLPSNTISLPPVVVAPLPVPTIGFGVSPTTTTNVTQPITGFSAPLVNNVSPTMTVQPITGFSAPLVNATGDTTPNGSTTPTIVVAPTVLTPLPELALGVGGRLAQLLPQVATGGGWQSTISIANNSATPQVVRVDFFNSEGGPLVLPNGSSATTVVVPGGGVVTVSTN